MNRARIWILIAAMTCFASGVGVGLLVPELTKPPAENMWGSDELFVSTFVEELGLSPEQEETLRMILAWREQEEIRFIKEHGFENLPLPVQTSLNRAREMADRRIEHILDEDQRRRYRELIKQDGGE